MPLKPNTKAEKGEYFPTTIDHDNKSYSIGWPTKDDTRHNKLIADIKLQTGRDIQASSSIEGPKYAETARQELEAICPGYNFVDSAYATKQTKITVIKTPLQWI